MKYIEVMAYGDFEVPYTHSIWLNLNLHKRDKIEISKSNPEDIIIILKKAGFKKIYTEKVYEED